MMRCGGRAFRQRRRRKRKDELDDDCFSCVWRMQKWICCHGFDGRACHVTARKFAATGRGLMALKSFKPGDVIISLPKNVLITSSVVRSSYLGSFISRWKLSSIEILAVFVICERRRKQLSPWNIYIESLPQNYTVPLFWKQAVLSLLPADIQQDTIDLQTRLAERFCYINELFASILQSFPEMFQQEIFTLSEFLWAWVSVNTRCVHLSGNKVTSDSIACNNQDDIALAPFLDLFNHSPLVQVEAGFDDAIESYVIRTGTHYRKYQEIFINYGPHSNKRLLLDYGFIVDSNPHDCYSFSLEDLCDAFATTGYSVNNNVKFVKQMKLDRGLVCTLEGLSWNLKTALLFLSSEYLDNARRVMDIYLQQNISEENEKRSCHLAEILLNKALDKIPGPTEEKSRQCLVDESELVCSLTSLAYQMTLKMRDIYTNILKYNLDLLYRGK